MLLRRKDQKLSPAGTLLLTLDDAPLVLDPQRYPPQPSATRLAASSMPPPPESSSAATGSARSSLPPTTGGTGVHRDVSPSLGGTRRSTKALTAIEWSPAAVMPQQQPPARSASASVGQLLAAHRKSLVVPPVLDYAGGLDGRARSSSGAAGTAVHGGHSAPRRSSSMATGAHAPADDAPSLDALVAVPLHYNDPLAGADVASLQEFLAAHPHARLIGRHPALAPPYRVRNRFVSRVHLVVEHFAVEESITLRAVIRDRFQRMEGTIRGHPEVALGNPDTTLEAGFERRRAKAADSQRTKVKKAAAAQRLGARPASKKWPPSSDEDNDSSYSSEDDDELRHDKKFAALLNRRLQAMLSLMVPASAAAADDDGTGEHPADSGAWRPTELVSNGRITLVTNVGNGPVFVGDVRVIPGVPFPIRANDVVSLLEAPARAGAREGQPAASFTAAPCTPSPVRAIGRPQPVGTRRSRSYTGL